jgi:hypothetical protein
MSPELSDSTIDRGYPALQTLWTGFPARVRQSHEQRRSVIESHPHSVERFGLGDQALDVERVGRSCTLRHDQRVIRTNDLSAGVDELLGKQRSNFLLVLSIMEWDASNADA